MAMRILSTRLLQSSNCSRSAIRALGQEASMSSSSSKPPSSTPAKSSSADQAVATKLPSTSAPRRESFRSKMASVFGGYVDPADPNEKPLPADKVNFPDVTDFATGEEKLFLLAFENGILDPYCNLPVERNGRGTKDNPVKVESFSDERTVACICEDAQTYMKYTNLCRGEPKRCSCGHWMELVEAPRFWEKIPKEDLIEVPFFRDLAEEGKLDKFLATGKLDDDHHDDHKQLH